MYSNGSFVSDAKDKLFQWIQQVKGTMCYLKISRDTLSQKTMSTCLASLIILNCKMIKVLIKLDKTEKNSIDKQRNAKKNLLDK